MVVTLTRAEPSCSSAKILHAESGFQYRESPVLLGLDDFTQFLPNWQCFCQEQDDFPATGMVSVDNVGGLQKLDASNRMSMAFFSMHGIPENHTIATGTATRRSKELLAPLALDVAKELKGAERNDWNTRPLTT